MQPTQPKKVILIAGSLLLGVIVLGVLVAYLVQPSLFQGLLGTPAGVTVVNLEQMKADLTLQKYNVAVPKSKASAEYYDVFNKALNEAVLMDDTNREVVMPLIAKVQAAYDAKTLDGLDALAAQIQTANQVQKNRISILTGYLNSLEAINADTTDADVSSLTVNFIKAGRQLTDAFTAYTALTDAVLSGSNVDANTVEQAKTTTANLLSAIDGFSTASKALVALFSQTIQAEFQAQTGTTTPGK